MERRDHPDGRSVVIDALLTGRVGVGVASDLCKIEVPGNGLVHEPFPRPVRDRKWSQAWRDAETFLSRAVTDVDSPAVDLDPDSAERGDAVDEEQRITCASRELLDIVSD